MMTLAVLHLVAAALRRRPRAPRGAASHPAERALHAATDHADLKRLIESQSRNAATPWWPGAGR